MLESFAKFNQSLKFIKQTHDCIDENNQYPNWAVRRLSITI